MRSIRRLSSRSPSAGQRTAERSSGGSLITTRPHTVDKRYGALHGHAGRPKLPRQDDIVVVPQRRIPACVLGPASDHLDTVPQAERLEGLVEKGGPAGVGLDEVPAGIGPQEASQDE